MNELKLKSCGNSIVLCCFTAFEVQAKLMLYLLARLFCRERSDYKKLKKKERKKDTLTHSLDRIVGKLFQEKQFLLKTFQSLKSLLDGTKQHASTTL